MQYRRDIDGLRCFAVVSVLLYHLNSQFLPGGFTGVDIFFVISGFLITRLLRADIEQGTFSLLRFYGRRIRRIFPALFAVLFTTLIFAVIGLEPNAYLRFLGEFRYAALQIANFKFAQELDYFAPGHDLSLLLHTWSLGVEEQFYLVWPWLLLAGARFLGKKSGYVLLLLGIGSFLLSDYLCRESPLQAFYLLHSRAWELSIGGLLTFIGTGSLRSRFGQNAVAVTGIILILLGFTRLNQYMPFPGKNALLPVIGAALLIYSGAGPKTIVSPLLENRFCVFIGRISYSLYLWHWPVIIAYKIVTGNTITVTSGVVIASISLLLATLSYYFIEQPFRRRAGETDEGERSKYRQLFFGISVPVLLLCLFFSYRWESNNRSTQVVLEIRGIHSPTKFQEEYVSLKWQAGGMGFGKDRAINLKYSNHFSESTNSYSFTFNIPSLHAIDSIRLDPLGGEGAIEILKVQVTDGILGWTRIFDGLGWLLESDVRTTHNVVFSRGDNGIRVESSSEDPYFLLFPKMPRFFENGLGVFTVVVIASLIFWAMRCANRRKSYPATVLYGLALVCFAITLSFRFQFCQYSDWRFAESKSSEYWTAATTRSDIHSMSTKGSAKAVLWGDSHVENFGAAVSEWARQKDLKLKIVYQPACPPIAIKQDEISSIKDVAIGVYPGCFSNNEKRLKAIENNPEIEYVFITMRYEFYLNHPYMLFLPAPLKKISYTCADFFRHSFDNTVARLRQAGKKIVLLGQIPVLKEDPISCIKRDMTILASFLPSRNPMCDIDPQFSDDALQRGIDMFEQTSAKDGSIYFFQSQKYISSIFGPNNALKYHDDNHLNAYGASLLEQPLLEELRSFDGNRVSSVVRQTAEKSDSGPWRSSAVSRR